MPELTSFIDLILKGFIGATGAVVSILVYMHYRLQRNDSWLRDFRSLHQAFWEDKDMAEVRSWFANENSYNSIVDVIRARREIAAGRKAPSAISSDDYQVLEKLDKFCNLMTSVQVLDPRFAAHKKLWRRLFVEYWVDQMFSDDRADLRWYVREFYRELETGWIARSTSASLTDKER